MWMDSSNKVSQEEVISPLSHDTTGAFSRKGKPITKDRYDPEWLDTFLVTLYLIFICSADLILYAGAGNLPVFDGSIFPVGEVSIIILCIIAFSVALILTLHFCQLQRIYKHLAVGIITFLVVYVFLRQFFQYYQQYAVGTYMVPLSVFIAIVSGGIAFAFFEQDKPLYRILFVVATGVLFLNVYATYHKKTYNQEFIETYTQQENTSGKGQRLIYLMFPNFSSYAFLSSLNTPESLRTRDIIQGFYQKHNFKIYSKAYVPDFLYTDNIVRTFNPSSDKKSKQHVMPSQLLDTYWRFHNPKNEYVHLQNNELYDYLKNKKYEISAYKSRDINMCRNQHKYNVNRCVEKVNHPVNLRAHEMPLGTRTRVLAMEWLTSMHLFGDISNAYKMVNKVFNLNQFPLINIDFNSLYVVNSFKTLDVVMHDIKQDKGDQAYFVFIDMPSNMYVYDERCRMKDVSQWQNAVNMPWYRIEDISEKQKAYMEQTLCLYGKVEQFMEQLKNEHLLDNTVVVIQGVSGVHGFKADTSHDSSLETFLKEKSVTMAIYDKKMENKDIDYRLCSTNQILAEYLFPDKKCHEHLEGYHVNIADGINKSMTKLTQTIKDSTVSKFDVWYNNWRQGIVGGKFDAPTITAKIPAPAPTELEPSEIAAPEVNAAPKPNQAPAEVAEPKQESMPETDDFGIDDL